MAFKKFFAFNFHFLISEAVKCLIVRKMEFIGFLVLLLIWI